MIKNTDSNTNEYLQSINDNELREKGIQLLAQGVLAIRQLSSEDFNSKVKEDFVFLLSDAIHKLPFLCSSSSSELKNLENRQLVENEIKLTLKAFEKFNDKFPHRSISYKTK